MTPEQYEVFLDDLRRLRRALGLPDGALPTSPRDAFLECIVAAERSATRQPARPEATP